MTEAYSGRWLWPPQECDHKTERRVPANRIVDQAGQLQHQIPEYCRDCGYTFAPARGDTDG